MHARNLVVVGLLSTTVACGGGGGSPTAPPSTPTLTGLSITPATDLVRIKANETFAANATFSDGSSRTVQSTWGSDAPGVATIESGGRVTGVASGQATIFADYQGQHATRLLRVLPDYQGRWQGDWSMSGCGDEGDWRGACGELALGSLWAIALEATQNRDAVNGTVDFGDNQPGQVAGTIRMSGHLVLSGTYTIVQDGLPFEFAVSDWETLTTDNDRMTGRFRLTMRVAGLQGSLRLDGELRVVAKTSAMSLVGARGDAARLPRALARFVRTR